jgi:CYTH domain
VEIELQYVYRGEEPLLVPTRLAGFPLAGSRATDLLDTYFDTRELDLRRAGCSLRLRRALDAPQPLLVFKGPAQRRPDGAKEREEIEVPTDRVPGGGAELEAVLEEEGVWQLAQAASGLDGGLQIQEIGRLANARSSHDYVHGLHRLELTWDRLEYPVGERQVRLEVEAHSRSSGRYLEQAREELEALFGKALVPARQGKSRELCVRLYPELLEAA